MRRLLSSHAPTADQSEELLTIVRRFDEMLVERADLDHLAVTAGQLIGALPRRRRRARGADRDR